MNRRLLCCARGVLALSLTIIFNLTLHAAPSNDPPLIAAIKNGQSAAIQSLLASGVDVNVADAHGYTAAMWAVSRGDAALLQALFNAGASLPKDSADFTALIEAVKAARTDIVRFLIGQGADVNVKDPQGNTALMLAAAVGRLDLAQALLNKGADFNRRNAHGQTALILAAQHGARAIINLLLDKGAKIDAQDEFGYTALIWAAHNHNTDTVKVLLARGADKTVKAKDGMTALDVANQRHYADTAQVLRGV